MPTSECLKNPQFPKHKSHSFHIRVIEDIHFVLCDWCDAPMNHPNTCRFLSHVEIESLVRLTSVLISKPLLSPAEKTLAEHMMKEVF